MEEFRRAWGRLFERHKATLITVWDGDIPLVEYRDPTGQPPKDFGYRAAAFDRLAAMIGDLFCRHTDACRNLGFVVAANDLNPDYILTLDDDVHPPAGSDPIQEHLDVLNRRVPISWMNTAMAGCRLVCKECRTVATDRHQSGIAFKCGKCGCVQPVTVEAGSTDYLRGFPYGIRDEAPVMVSHGVWVNVPDFDGRTQLELGKCQRCDGDGKAHGSDRPFESSGTGDYPGKCPKCGGTSYDGSKLPYSLPYFRGPVPRGCYFPFCGMNVMVRKEALPYLYFAPMGPDSGADGLNRFADIWCGILLKRACDANNWAIYTGASTVVHTRASDPHKNVEQEKLGIEWNEWAYKQFGPDWSTDKPPEAFTSYWRSYLDKATRFRDLIIKLQEA